MRIKELLEYNKRTNPYFKQDITAYDHNRHHWDDLQDANIMMQLIKNVDRKGERPIRFKDGSEIKISSGLSHKILLRLGEFPAKQRHMLVNKLITSKDVFKQFVKQQFSS